MTESPLADWATLIALVVPLLGFAPVLVMANLAASTRWAQGGALAAGSIWLVLLLTGARGTIDRLAAGDVALAACTGAALIALAAAPAAGHVTGAALTAVTTGMVLTGGDPSLRAVGIALAGTAVLAAAAPPMRPRISAAAAVVAAVVVLGIASDDPATAALLVMAGGAGVALVAGARSRHPTGLLLPPVLLVAARVLPDAAGEASVDTVAVVVAVVAAITASVRALPTGRITDRLRGLGSPVSALALFALVAAAEPVPGTRPAALLLGAAAILNAALPAPLTVLTALPGADLLVRALADSEGARPTALIALMLVTAGALAAATRPAPEPVPQPGIPPPAPPPEPERLLLADRLAAVPALLVGLWLVVAPSTWEWAGPAGLDVWGEGAALAVASALVAVLLLGAASRRLPALLPAGLGLAPVVADHRPVRPTAVDRLAALVALVVLGGAVIVLVVSTSS